MKSYAYACDPSVEPRKGWLFVVRYVSDNGTTQSRWYRQGAGARRFAEWVIAHGDAPRIYRTEVTRWQEDWPPQTSRGVRRRWSDSPREEP